MGRSVQVAIWLVTFSLLCTGIKRIALLEVLREMELLIGGEVLHEHPVRAVRPGEGAVEGVTHLQRAGQVISSVVHRAVPEAVVTLPTQEAFRRIRVAYSFHLGKNVVALRKAALDYPV